jgi:hypothetical protein
MAGRADVVGTEYLPLRDAAHYAGKSEKTLRRAIRSLEHPLPALRVGLGDPRYARIMIRRRDLIAWIEQFRVQPADRAMVDEIIAKMQDA